MRVSATRVASKRARDKCKINTAALFAGQFFSLFARRSRRPDLNMKCVGSYCARSLKSFRARHVDDDGRRKKTLMCRRSEIYSAAASGTYKSVPRFTNKRALACLRERKTHTRNIGGLALADRTAPATNRTRAAL